MVIAIIGMLVALVSVAAVHTIARARQAENTLTIDTLDQAVQNAKSQYGMYPPDCSNLGPQSSASSFGQTYRQNRILQFFRKAFPRMTVTGYGPSDSSDPPPGTLQYLSQYSAFGKTGSGNQISAYSSSSIHLGDLNNLDPAEAMVFFLGGPVSGVPQTLGSSKYSFALAGFSANPQNPFAAGGSRLTSLYQFNQGRLGDVDADGWPEYYPPSSQIPQPLGTGVTSPANPSPPYVYFDSVTYESWIKNYGVTSTSPSSSPPPYPGAYPFYNDPSTPVPIQPTSYANQTWGLAVPYMSASNLNATINSNDFMNPQKFQIIGAGADNMYGMPGVSSNALRYFPSTINYTQGDYDNVSNFTSGALQDTPAQ